MEIKKFADRINTKNAEEKAANERLITNAEQAKEILSRIFGRLPESRNEAGEPVTCDGPEFITEAGVKIVVGQTNHFGGPGLAYNLCIRDEDGVIHSYAQVREKDTAIFYWGTNDHQRLTGTAEQDSEVLDILLEAEQAQAS